MEDNFSDLLDVTREWDMAMVRNNAEEISKFMSDAWVIVGSDGVTTKEKFLSSIISGDLIHSKMDSDDIKINIHDNTGIVISRGTSAGSFRGKAFSFYEWSTSVFIKQKGKWFCVITMITPADQ